MQHVACTLCTTLLKCVCVCVLMLYGCDASNRFHVCERLCECMYEPSANLRMWAWAHKLTIIASHNPIKDFAMFLCFRRRKRAKRFSRYTRNSSLNSKHDPAASHAASLRSLFLYMMCLCMYFFFRRQNKNQNDLHQETADELRGSSKLKHVSYQFFFWFSWKDRMNECVLLFQRQSLSRAWCLNKKCLIFILTENVIQSTERNWARERGF